MLRNELFKNLAKVNKDDRILLLTHDDADGAGAEIVLRCMFPEKNIEAVHLNNGDMSRHLKETLTDVTIAERFSKVIACDISCNGADAEYINSLPDINSRFVLLDHHLTSQYVNKYSWGISFSDMIEDSFLTGYYSKSENGHSSGTSLLLDYMYYCGIDFLPDASRVAAENICLWISAYDTWDWITCFEGNDKFKDENLLFAAYGNNLYVRRKLSKIGLLPIYYGSDRIMLKAEKEKNISKVLKTRSNLEQWIPYWKMDVSKYMTLLISTIPNMYLMFWIICATRIRSWICSLLITETGSLSAVTKKMSMWQKLSNRSEAADIGEPADSNSRREIFIICLRKQQEQRCDYKIEVQNSNLGGFYMIICKYLSVIGILVNTASLMIFRNTISYEKISLGSPIQKSNYLTIIQHNPIFGMIYVVCVTVLVLCELYQLFTSNKNNRQGEKDDKN